MTTLEENVLTNVTLPTLIGLPMKFQDLTLPDVITVPPLTVPNVKRLAITAMVPQYLCVFLVQTLLTGKLSILSETTVSPIVLQELIFQLTKSASLVLLDAKNVPTQKHVLTVELDFI
jgi:hypothetical protein